MALLCVCTVLLTFILCSIRNPPWIFFSLLRLAISRLCYNFSRAFNTRFTRVGGRWASLQWESLEIMLSSGMAITHLRALRKCRYGAAVLLHWKCIPHSPTTPCSLFQLSQQTTGYQRQENYHRHCVGPVCTRFDTSFCIVTSLHSPGQTAWKLCV